MADEDVVFEYGQATILLKVAFFRVRLQAHLPNSADTFHN
jgi:hypothetical protein